AASIIEGRSPEIVPSGIGPGEINRITKDRVPAVDPADLRLKRHCHPIKPAEIVEEKSAWRCPLRQIIVHIGFRQLGDIAAARCFRLSDYLHHCKAITSRRRRWQFLRRLEDQDQATEKEARDHDSN